MKQILLALLFVTCVYPQRLTEKMVTNNGVTIVDRDFSRSTLDTTRSIDVRFADDYFLGISTYDSARMYVSYQTSNDNSTWTVKTVLDSVINTNNAGSYEVWDLSSIVRGTQYLRFIYDFQSGHIWQDSTLLIEEDLGTWNGVAYDTLGSDTSRWINISQYQGDWLVTVRSLDSARFIVYYEIADDTTNPQGRVFVDSLVVTSNDGGEEDFDFSAALGDSTYARVIVSSPAGYYGQGTTTATYGVWDQKQVYRNGNSSGQFDAVASRKED